MSRRSRHPSSRRWPVAAFITFVLAAVVATALLGPAASAVETQSCSYDRTPLASGADEAASERASEGSHAAARSPECSYDDAGNLARVSARQSGSAPNTTDPNCDPDHIVLGLEAYGLRRRLHVLGGRHLLDDPNWRYTFLEALGDPSVRFTISLDGLDGVNPTEQLRTAVHRGASGNPSPTNWEIAQLHQVGRLSTTSLVEDRGRTSVPNPWPATGFPP